MTDTPTAPSHAGRAGTDAAAGGRDGARALAVRVIGETGARAARRPFADAVHPARPPVPAGRRRLEAVLDRVPSDLARRVLRRADRALVDRAGGLLLALRRVDRDEAVRQLHHLDHRCFELEQRVRALEARAAD